MITLCLICLVKKKINPILTELLIRGRKLNISLIFIMYLIFLFQKHIRLNSKHYLIIEIKKKRELQQIAFNHLSNIEFKDFTNF